MDAKSGCLRDAISFLPHEVLAKILSSLPTKLAASTSLLSTKWRNVFALVDNLDFDNSDFLQPEQGKLERDEIRETFRNFVDTTLALQRASPINKLSLKLVCYYDSELDSLYHWVCNAAERGVSDMELIIKERFKVFLRQEPGDSRGPVFLPRQLFTSKTLVKLSLGKQLILLGLPPDLYLPALKILSIDSIFFESLQLSQVLLAGCLILEELTVCHKDYMAFPYFISSRTIQKLTVDYDCESELDFSSGMTFVAPSLVFFDYSDYAMSEYPRVSFKSLVEARLDLRFTEKIQQPDLSGLVIGISNVQTLHLSPRAVHVFSRCCKDGLVLPVFNNLLSLSFESNNKRGWKLLPYLLKQSPKLETLTIQSLDGYTGHTTLRSFQVKVLNVVGYRGELGLLKSFLTGMESLELLGMEMAEDIAVDDDTISQIYEDLCQAVPSLQKKAFRTLSPDDVLD